LIRNKNDSQWVKLYTVGKSGDFIGKIKIKASYFKDKSFSPRKISKEFPCSPTASQFPDESLRSGMFSNLDTSLKGKKSNEQFDLSYEFEEDSLKL
jgi:hypothetical protein